jgi:glycosyltransferase involved in cell wall biosynthesis
MTHTNKRPVVSIYQEWIPDYREAFFVLLHEEFKQVGIEMKLYAGRPSSKYLGRSESSISLPFVKTLNRLDLRLKSHRFSWTFLGDSVRGSTLLVFEQARRNLEIYPLLFLTKSKRKPKIVLWGHGHDNGTKGLFSAKLLQKLTLRADALFLYAQRPTAKGPFEESRTFEIGNSLYKIAEISAIQNIEVGASPLSSVLFLGAVSKEKGIDEFIALAELAHDSGSSLKFVVAGPDNEKYFSIRSMPKNLEYIGAVSGKVKCELISSAICLVIPDSIGLVAIDAVVHNKVIYTNQAATNHGPEIGYLKDSGLIRTYLNTEDLLMSIESARFSLPGVKSLIQPPSLEGVVENFVESCLRVLRLDT